MIHVTMKEYEVVVIKRWEPWLDAVFPKDLTSFFRVKKRPGANGGNCRRLLWVSSSKWSGLEAGWLLSGCLLHKCCFCISFFKCPHHNPFFFCISETTICCKISALDNMSWWIHAVCSFCHPKYRNLGMCLIPFATFWCFVTFVRLNIRETIMGIELMTTEPSNPRYQKLSSKKTRNSIKHHRCLKTKGCSWRRISVATNRHWNFDIERDPPNLREDMGGCFG